MHKIIHPVVPNEHPLKRFSPRQWDEFLNYYALIGKEPSWLRECPVCMSYGHEDGMDRGIACMKCRPGLGICSCTRLLVGEKLDGLIERLTEAEVFND